MSQLTRLSLITPDFGAVDFAILDGVGRHDADVLMQRAAGVATSLSSLRKSSGRVIVSLNKGVGFFAGIVGCWMADRVPVLLDPMVRTELGEAVTLTEADVVLVEKERLTEVKDIDAVTPDCGLSTPLPSASVTSDTVALFLFTSGSTGKPTLVPKTYSQIQVEVDFLSKLFETPKKVAGLIPWCHIWGLLSSFLLPLKNGGVCDLRAGISARGVLTHIANQEIDFVAAVPIYYTAMMKLINAGLVSIKGTSCRFASASAPLAGLLREQFAEATGQGITDIFGSTEAGGIAYRHQDGPWRLEPHVEMRVDGDGMLSVRSPSVAFKTDDGFYPTGDMVQPLDEKGFLLLGRGDDVVKIGGRRIALGEIKRVIESLDGVGRAEVLTISVQGTLRLVAFVEAVVSHLTTNSIKHHVRDILADHKVPRAIRFVKKLPMTSSGKLDRQQLLKMEEARLSMPKPEYAKNR